MSELTLEVLAQRLETLEKQNTELAETNGKLAEANEKLQALIGTATSLEVGAKPKKPEIPKDEITIDKSKYKFAVASFYPPGATEPITSLEASTDKKLLAAIVKIAGQGILKEVL